MGLTKIIALKISVHSRQAPVRRLSDLVFVNRRFGLDVLRAKIRKGAANTKASPRRILGIHFPLFLRHLRAASSDVLLRRWSPEATGGRQRLLQRRHRLSAFALLLPSTTSTMAFTLTGTHIDGSTFNNVSGNMSQVLHSHIVRIEAPARPQRAQEAVGILRASLLKIPPDEVWSENSAPTLSHESTGANRGRRHRSRDAVAHPYARAQVGVMDIVISDSTTACKLLQWVFADLRTRFVLGCKQTRSFAPCLRSEVEVEGRSSAYGGQSEAEIAGEGESGKEREDGPWGAPGGDGVVGRDGRRAGRSQGAKVENTEAADADATLGGWVIPGCVSEYPGVLADSEVKDPEEVAETERSGLSTIRRCIFEPEPQPIGSARQKKKRKGGFSEGHW
ncbi:hypothetical protein B0H14DRAFT_2621488 [Mycena olivaceomarginata]|nr:hypothetical protein B0H14DRAFT_2621488 [Mycena olivaceomarginata]